MDEEALNKFLSTYQKPERKNPLGEYGLTLNDSLYVTQCEIIDRLTAMGPCVIIGRTAAEVLHNNPKCINVFISASKEDRIERIMKLYDFSEKEAASTIRQMDRRRKFYYETYTEKEWLSPESYQLMLNTSLLGRDKTVEIIKWLYFEGQK